MIGPYFTILFVGSVWLVGLIIVSILAIFIWGEITWVFCFKHFRLKNTIGYIHCLKRVDKFCPKCTHDNVSGCKIIRQDTKRWKQLVSNRSIKNYEHYHGSIKDVK